MPRKVVSVKAQKVVDAEEENGSDLNGIVENNSQNNDLEDEKIDDVNSRKKKVPVKRGKKKADKKIDEENKNADNASGDGNIMNGEKEKQADLNDVRDKSSEGESSSKTEEHSKAAGKVNPETKLTTKAFAKRGRKKIENENSEGTLQNQESEENVEDNHSEKESEKSVGKDIKAPVKRGKKKIENKSTKTLQNQESEENLNLEDNDSEKESDVKKNANDYLVEDTEVTAPNKRGRRKQENKVSQATHTEEKNVKGKEKNASKQPTRRGAKKQEVNEKTDQEGNSDASPTSSVSKSIPAKQGRKRKNETEDVKQMPIIDESEEQPAEQEKVAEKSRQNEKNILKKELRVVLKRAENVGETKMPDEIEQKAPTKKAKQEITVSPKKTGGAGARRKRAKGDNKEESDEDFQPKKPAKVPKDSANPKSPLKKEKIPDVTNLDFSNKSVSPTGKAWNMKISSWNVNGIRAWLEKDGISYLHHEKPDILCIQETKCSDEKLPEEVKKIQDYDCYWLSGDKDGYSGVGLLSKQTPSNVQYGIGIDEHDNEGRVITAEYDKFYIVATYVPNAGRGLVRLEYRMKWDKDFSDYLKKLNEKKPVILCGDLNVAHEEIDLANPKTNKKNAGFTKEEREGFSTLLKEGFIDSFRHLYPDTKAAYTFWTYMMNARAKNVGWRLDYFVISKDFTDSLCDSVIRKDVYGSDHCPIALFISV